MASTTYSVIGDKKPSPIYVRFTEKRIIDIMAKTGLYVNPAHWDKKKGRIRNVIEMPNRDAINSKLGLLQVEIIDEYNVAYARGEVIDRQWLDGVIKKSFNRPKGEEKGKLPGHLVYLSDFALWWINEKAPTHKVSSEKYMEEITIRGYFQALENIKSYEVSKKTKIKLTEITGQFMDDFSSYLSTDLKYAEATVKRKMTRIKFFCERAVEENIEVNKNYKQRVFVKKKEIEYKMPYLNEEEISRIANLNLSFNPRLAIARDNFIIGLWTGLRISDFLTGLSIDNIDGEFIRIKTKKRGHQVAIPLHSMVKDVLKKYFNNLPPKMAEQDFNEYIKEITRMAGIDNDMVGGIMQVDPKTGDLRKVIDVYPKYKLVTSHICRRSLCTNLLGKVPNKVIMDIQGWKEEKQMFAYNQQTNLESAINLKNYWDNILGNDKKS